MRQAGERAAGAGSNRFSHAAQRDPVLKPHSVASRILPSLRGAPSRCLVPSRSVIRFRSLSSPGPDTQIAAAIRVPAARPVSDGVYGVQEAKAAPADAEAPEPPAAAEPAAAKEEPAAADAAGASGAVAEGDTTTAEKTASESGAAAVEAAAEGEKGAETAGAETAGADGQEGGGGGKKGGGDRRGQGKGRGGKEELLMPIKDDALVARLVAFYGLSPVRAPPRSA